ncbi:hypothetical protein COV15_02340 [Candidatus Woesearchaeota archaeon CG10_big_fil_rev_8_21_14_0_10_34_12]|nr:MAG: hypothetical protein COV15_02340 [Candidatus Woesearchaeota archaeon CG10_big_fil_rev_8_21_14_0_10_34_12]
MRQLNILLGFLILAFLIPVVSAGISISQPNSVYNLRDKIDISVTANNGEGFLSVYLICTDQILLHKEYLELKTERKIDVRTLLDNSLLGENQGECLIKADFDELSAFTPSFEITNKINVFTSIKKTEYNPGEDIQFSGKAVLANSKNLEGYAEVSVEDLGIILVSDAKTGIFSFNFTIPKTAKSKTYTVSVKTYDSDKINYGETSLSMSVKQIPTQLDIKIENQMFNPGEIVKITPIIYDQAGDVMSGQITLKIANPEKEAVKEIISSQQEKQIKLETNSPPGEWKIKLEGLNLEKEKSFYVNEKMLASFELINGSLIVKSIGNIPYKKTIEVSIAGDKRIIEVELNLGNKKEYLLQAPTGEYDVKVSDGIKEASNKMSLTGNAIGIKDAKSRISILQKYPVVWLFLVAVFATFIFVLSKNIRKGSFVLSEPIEKLRGGIQVISLGSRGELKEKTSLDEKISGTANPTAVLRGHKQTSTILSIELKNHRELGNFEEEAVISALSEVKKHKGSVYKSEGFITIVFSPLVTKTFNNEASAIKIAADISHSLIMHNKKSKKKIKFGIGVNSGEIIASFDKKAGKLDYTSLGKTVSESKKIAKHSEGEILISQPVYHKLMSEIYCNKKGEYFEVIEIRERDKYNKFVKDFLNRQKEEKK